MWLPCFCFPAVPHFNDHHLRVTCPTSRTSTATSTAPSTVAASLLKRFLNVNGRFNFETAVLIRLFQKQNRHLDPEAQKNPLKQALDIIVELYFKTGTTGVGIGIIQGYV
jgi:hypothetical protein